MMLEQPQWLAGLTRVADGGVLPDWMYKDPESGVVLVDKHHFYRTHRGHVPVGKLPITLGAKRGRTQKSATVELHCAEMKADDVPAVAAALKLAARLAREYNEMGGA